MKHIFTLLTTWCMAAASLFAQDMMITGVFDGPLSGGTPKAIEFYVINNIADLSIYGMGSANNGNGGGVVEFTFPSVAATAGQYLYVASTSADFLAYFGFAPDYVSSQGAGINGNDAIELFLNGVPVDVFGQVSVDGTGTAWDYMDGWAYRNNNTTPSTTFNAADWSFSGIDANDNQTSNATATLPWPIGTFTSGGSNITTHQVSVGGGSNSFQPANITITQGDSVVWTNLGGTHNVDGRTTTYPNNPTSFYSGTPSGAAWVYGFKFDVPGFYQYQCNPHAPSMVGTVTVLPLNPSVEFVNASATVNENAGTVTVNLQIIGGNANATAVTVALGGGSTASSGTDFTFTSPTLVTFPANSTANQSVTLTILDDASVETAETVVLTLSNPTNNATIGTKATYTLTITDNDNLAPTYPSYDIATVTTVNATGSSDSLNVNCTLTGIVYGIDYQGNNNLGFTLIDNTGGIGVFSTNNFGYTVQEGDELRLKGTISQFNGLTQIEPDSLTVLSTGNAIISPAPLVTVLNESTESELVRLEGVTAVDIAQWNTSGSSFNFEVTNGTTTFTIRIDSDTDIAGTTPFGANDVLSITGLGGQFDNADPYTEGYQLLPRYLSDIQIVSSIKTPNVEQLVRVYPNPTQDWLVIESDWTIENIRIFNGLGQLVKEVSNPTNFTQLNLQSWATGTYNVHFTTPQGTFTKQIVKN